ncbi:MAG: hypothetical protein OXE42_10365 [Gammaproteobacteria bacterium]|nr:hypothetical protein [Gammaproteobacteria bacterium]
MRVGFLFNHYLTYQVLHGAPFAFALSRTRPDFHVELLFSTKESYAEAQRIATLYPGQQCHFRLLRRLGGDLVATRFPSLHRPLVLLANAGLLATFNALVAPEKNFILLKALSAFQSVKFIGLRHGVGPSYTPLNKGALKFDCYLGPGRSYYERYKDELPVGCCEIVGYPKFEVLQKLKPAPPVLFDNDRPVVLYTPHFNPRLSSWLTMGQKILGFFKNSSEYNLIFAPHVRLFKHASCHGNISLEGFRDAAHILIDTGSERSHDMTYTLAADIYVGDISSQVAEFIYWRRRPCVFLNPLGLEPSSMKFWKMGPVINGDGDIGKALTLAGRAFDEKYKPEQDIFADASFAPHSRPPSVLGAEAIIRFLSKAFPVSAR